MTRLRVNGKSHTYQGDRGMPLLWFLRDILGLTGTKYGCGEGLCGACTVHVDGAAARACRLSMGDLQGAAITTIEGLSARDDHPLQRAWSDQRVPQCGYCQPGQIMQAAALLKGNPLPTDAEIEDAMHGNICRCGTYARIKKAIRQATGGAR